MNTVELSHALINNPVTRPYTGSVKPSDRLPSTVHINEKCFVFNTDPVSKPGRHWVAIYLSETPEFFDSAGHTPSHYNHRFEKFLMKQGPTYKLNLISLQSNSSELCGQYCLYYLTKRCLGLSMEYILREFGADKKSNDKIVQKYYDNVIKRYVCIY